jgi:ribonuclease T1
MGAVTTRVALLIAVLAALLVGPSVVIPARVPNADATVYRSCTIARCADAREARAGWAELDFPTTRGWRAWPSGRYNFAGGRFRNAEKQLPAGATYYEYDVYPRAKGAARDAYRIVVARSSGAAWFSPNHYGDFYRL